MEPKTVREVVALRGRVQGVGLRDTVVDIARDHRVAGTVRNLRGGSTVEIDVEGERAQLDAFLADVLANLPTFAVVESIERKAAAPRGATSFRREASL